MVQPINFAKLSTVSLTAMLLVGLTSTADTFALTANGTAQVLGVTDEVVTADQLARKVQTLHAPFGLHRLIASGAIPAQSPIAPAAGGKTQAATSGVASFNVIGIALTAAAADGDSYYAFLGQTPLNVESTVGTEAANAIALTLQTNLKGSFQYQAHLILNATGAIALSAAYTMAVSGGGTAISTTAQGQLTFRTSDAGAAVLTVTDVSGSSTASLRVMLTPIGVAGAAHQKAITFA